MNFLAPSALLLSIILPIIIAMYLLKLRRTEQIVSSIYLWKRMVRDVEANAPWQRLRHNPLLLLQLLFLSVLILALAQPFTWTIGASGQSVIFILDTSASMASVDAVPNRLDAAKGQAWQMVDGLPDDARVTVIAASDQAQVLASSSQDRRQIYQVIDSLEVSLGSSNLTSALELASAIAARQSDTEIIIFSDGQVSLPDQMEIKGQLRYFPIGTSDNNQAISILSLDTTPGSTKLTAFAQITNYSAQEAQRRLELYADGTLVNAFDLQIPARDQRAVIAEDLPADTEMVKVVLTGQDTLSLDDQAWALAAHREPTPVTLVTEGNRFLEIGLGLLPGISVALLTPEEFEAQDRTSAAEETSFSPILEEAFSQITIFDAYMPINNTFPEGSLLFIAPPRSNEFFDVVARVEQPVARIVDPNHPLVSNLNISQVNILDAVQITQPEWAERILEGETGGSPISLLTVGRINNRHVAVLSFDIRRSDLPLQVAFPLLLANLVEWLSPGRTGELPSQVLPGTALSLTLPPGISNAIVTYPDNRKTELSLTAGRAIFSEINQLGVYQVNWQNEGEARFAVNLFSPIESNVAPAPNLTNLDFHQSDNDNIPMQARREWWRPLGFSALAFLIAEWLVYQRANLARLAGRLSRRAT